MSESQRRSADDAHLGATPVSQPEAGTVSKSPRIESAKEAAKRTGVPIKLLYKLAQEGRLRRVPGTRRALFVDADVDEVLFGSRRQRPG